jgi:excisionase family DNA binding protein
MTVVAFPKQPMQERPEILTRDEVASYCKVSKRTIDRWVREEGMPSELWGPRIRRFRLADVDRWLRRRAS